MAAFAQLFGDKLQGKAGEVSTVEALGGKSGVLVYFSAHWCPPCRGFTPKLVEFHTKHAAAKGFETVFVSSDKDQSAFDEYYGEMPWLALPFSNRDAKGALSKRYKVKGIPSLVVLGPDGNVVTTNGRQKVMENFNTCEGFPWVPPTFSEVLGDSFLRQDGSTTGLDAVKGKTLGLYFSAHWCGPCRNFTPKLKEFYGEYKKKSPDFELIFCSGDHDEAEMQSYFKEAHGDYLALPYDEEKYRTLSDMFGVEGIPTFVVVGPDGSVVNPNARGKVIAGAAAVLEAGWEPPSVGDLAEGADVAGTDINECPSVVVLCEGADAATQASVKQAMEPLAKKYIAESKAVGDDPKYIFFIAAGGGMVDQLKALTKKGAGDKVETAGGKLAVLLFDIPDQGGFYVADIAKVTTEGLETFLKSKESGKEARMQLSK